MATTDPTSESTPASAPAELESGTYEVIQNRLRNSAKELRSRLDRLNEARKDVFGSIETALISTERITTEHNCVPRDMVAVGQRFLFGYNVHFGLKTEIELKDVFAVYRLEEGAFHAEPLDLIRDDAFEKDFADVYRYYKSAVFAKFMLIGPHLFMVFRVGKSVSDIKTFKWLLRGDTLTYLDNRSEHECRFPPQHDFTWTRTHRDFHQAGRHPHISIDDRLFVETIGGDLTIKIENNTETGEGIYSEPVENEDQTLDDAEIFYAIVGNLILLKIRPYQEEVFRYLVYSEKIQKVTRLDSIAHACVLLPDDQGLIFSNGYYLQNGDYKIFESGLTDMLYERQLVAQNGEDYLYVFYNRSTGTYVLLQYNRIEQRVETPLVCHGFSLFEAGEMILFKHQDEPQKHHAIQLWQTPYVGENFVAETVSDSYLYKIGNRDIVRGMAECQEIVNLIGREDSYANLYVDLVKLSGDVVDAYFWLDREEAFDLKSVLTEIHRTASNAVEEYEKVIRVRKATADQTRQVERRVGEITSAIAHKRFQEIDDFVASLSDLRTVRGEIISLRDLRYVDVATVERLETQVAEESDTLAGRCVEFLLRPEALDPYIAKVRKEKDAIGDLTKVSDAREVEKQITAGAQELEMLIEIVSNLKIEDATQRTAIIDSISAIFTDINQARAALKTKTRELLSVEGVAEFNSQMKLLNQGVVNYLDISDTPEKCEEFLTKLMIQVEELEGRFAEFDEFVVQLTEKREEIYNAFESRKLSLVEARNKRANALAATADRILNGIKARVDSLESVEDIHGYFASDLMIEKVRDIVRQLDELDDSVKVDDIQSRLKSIREDAVRQLKDRQELFVGGENVIRLGKHQFSVNVQALDLTLVHKEGEMCLHLTGTNFVEPIADERLESARDLWDQELVSETRNVYRAEFLAGMMLASLRDAEDETALQAFAALDAAGRLGDVQKFMGPRYSEGYVKGVHDHDAAMILHALVEMELSVGLLRYSRRARAMAAVFWEHFIEKRDKTRISARLNGFAAVVSVFPRADACRVYVEELQQLLEEFAAETELYEADLAGEAAEYLFQELVFHEGFAESAAAQNLFREFHTHLERSEAVDSFAASLKHVQRDHVGKLRLLRDWLDAFADAQSAAIDPDELEETAAILLRGKLNDKRLTDAGGDVEIEGLMGSHPLIVEGKYRLNFNHFLAKLSRYRREIVPRFESLAELKKTILEEAREELRLEEFRPRVLTSFVRNRLLDTVYLPLIGDNLAKQIGSAGEGKRTDLMGLLLLVSPPGYGKTTLMEYIANRLGVIFMKINGPAIGHQVTSLDPASAPNAGAREELQKLNLSFEMGDNVMIYVDDIQHCNPEFLQKFISLCDAQRKIEGVYKGKPRTYDFRGRKVAVVMAGNPYTESGEKFQIPDMLTNRADIYNLGEIIGGNAEAFEMSYLENSLTSNPLLANLASRSRKDVYSVIRLAEDPSAEGVDLEGNYSSEELAEMVATMRKLLRVRDVILTVNREYIRSAAQSDENRTEPPFKLQGSYRNMNRIAEKVLPVLNDEELQELIISNYQNDAQTLTSNTEANLLKFKELAGLLTESEEERWNRIRNNYQRNVRLRNIAPDDKVGQVIVELGTFRDGLDAIRGSLDSGLKRLLEQNAVAAQPPAVSQDETPMAVHVGTVLEQLGGLQSAIAGLGTSVSTALGQVADATERAAEARPAPAVAPPAPRESDELTSDHLVRPEQHGDLSRITVVNKLPSSVLKVLQQQFKVMNSWMDSLLQNSRTQGKELEHLRESVERCLQSYEHLIQRIQAGWKDAEEE